VRREVPAHENPRLARGAGSAASPGGRWLTAAIALLLALGGCDRSQNHARDTAAIAEAVEKAKREDEEADRRLREHAIDQELARRESEQAEVDAQADREETTQATLARLEERLRAVLVDPSSLELRNARLASDGETLCTEFNAKNKQGVYLGFRRAVVSDTVLSLEQDPDDNYREPQHRFAEMARVTGCFPDIKAQSAAATPK